MKRQRVRGLLATAGCRDRHDPEWGGPDAALEPGLADASIARCDAGEVAHLPDATHGLAREELERVTALLPGFLSL